jgi:hypothetical protein
MSRTLAVNKKSLATMNVSQNNIIRYITGLSKIVTFQTQGKF